MSKFIKGEILILYVWNATEMAWLPIACLQSNALSQVRNIIESQTKCAPGLIVKDAGSLNNEFSFEGLYTDDSFGVGNQSIFSHGTLFNIMNGGGVVEVKMDTGLTDNDAYYAEGILSDLSLDAPSGDEIATFSGTLTVSGNVSTVNSHP